ncbi:MAG: TspO protein, partial [Marinilabiliales bacterium]
PYALEKTESRNVLIIVFAIQWILNVAWSPVFFKFNAVMPGLIIIIMLTAVVIFMFFYWLPQIKWVSLLLAPYIIWLLIATSLNAYILVKN